LLVHQAKKEEKRKECCRGSGIKVGEEALLFNLSNEKTIPNVESEDGKIPMGRAQK